MNLIAGFSMDEARLLANFCCQAYGGGSSPPPFPAPWKKLQEFNNPNTNNSVLVAQADACYALAFRGTVPSDIQNDLEDLNVAPCPCPYPSNPDAQVHEGFLDSFRSLLDVGLADFIAGLEEAGGALYLTGHSLGAAMATLCRSYLATKRPITTKLYTFASPKVGNYAYATAFDRAFTNTGFSYRVANDCDAVPQVPLTFQLVPEIDLPKGLRWLKLFLRKLDAFDYTHVGAPFALKGNRANTNLLQQHAITTYMALLSTGMV